MSDSEYDFVAPAKTKKAKKPATKAAKTSEEPARGQKRKPSLDIFGLNEDEDYSVAGDAVKLPSYIVAKVANGVQRRCAATTGQFYVELRVYDRSDAESCEADERWKKALLRLSCLVEDDSTQWRHLQRCVRELNELFKGVDPQFMSNLITFKKK